MCDVRFFFFHVVFGDRDFEESPRGFESAKLGKEMLRKIGETEQWLTIIS